MMFKDQANVSPYRGMPIELHNNGEKLSSIVADSITLKYFNGTTLTTDAGQAAGTLVVGKFSVGKIKNQIGTGLANDDNSSLVVTSTALTTLEESTPTTFEGADKLSLQKQLTQIASGFENGEYVIDYDRGVVYGKKADTSVSFLATYSVGTSTASTDNYKSYLVRDAAITTNSYVAGTVISGADIYNQLIVYIDFTIGSLTSGEVKIEFSADGTNYYQETYGSISATVNTLSLGENKMSASGAYRIATPVMDKYIKISTKGTGTVTSSSVKITAVLGNA